MAKDCFGEPFFHMKITQSALLYAISIWWPNFRSLLTRIPSSVWRWWAYGSNEFVRLCNLSLRSKWNGQRKWDRINDFKYLAFSNNNVFGHVLLPRSHLGLHMFPSSKASSYRSKDLARTGDRDATVAGASLCDGERERAYTVIWLHIRWGNVPKIF